jgi:pimeloyl-ACP methyl ester carboxylesterase
MQPIILLHGALGAASSLYSLSKLLDPHSEVHILDFSGHGEARWPEHGFSVETFESDVVRLMDARGISAAHVFGYSMGGFVGLRLAARLPKRFLSVTTLATKMDWTEATCSKESAMLNADAMESKVPKFVAALSAAHPRNGWRMIVEHTQELIRSMSQYRFSPEDLASINLPVRLMVGDRDKMVGLDETIATYRALPNASLCVLPDTPHPLENVNRQLLASLIHNTMVKADS